MRINHNLAALNTYRQMNSNSTNSQKSLEKLSSGLRINKAGDDAAGLAISEKMRAQIRGLDQASRNSQDGISMIQTAEGALNETHSILQRMRELANQSANDTNVDVDRGEIQKEINQLTSEVNRIGNTTEFNTQKILNGGGSDPTSSVSGSGLTVPANLTGGSGESEQLASTSFAFIDADGNAATSYDGTSIDLTIDDKDITIEFTDGGAGSTATGSTATDSETGAITITVDVLDDATGELIAEAVRDEISTIVAGDEDLTAGYSVTTATTNKVTISATDQSIDTDGELVGSGVDGVVQHSTADSMLTGVQGSATATIGATTGDLTVETDGAGDELNGFKFAFADANQAAAVSISGDTITLTGDFSALGANKVDVDTLAELETLFNTALTNANYTDQISLAVDGTFTEGDFGGETTTAISGAEAAADATINTGALGANGTAEIDFTDKTSADLVGTGLVIDGKKIEFYDSGDGEYSGDAAISVDLNGARTAEAIVDKIVEAGHTTTTSNFDDVFVTKSTDDSNKLVITSKNAEAAANDIELYNNSTVEVTNTYGNSRIDGEAVNSAKGLIDGEHKVTIKNAGVNITSGTSTLPGADETVSETTGLEAKLEDGSYRLIGTGTADEASLEVKNADNTWTTLDTADVTTGDGTVTFTVKGEEVNLTVGNYAAAEFTDSTDSIGFTVENQYQAWITESGDDETSEKGTVVDVKNGQTSVELTSYNGVGEANVDIGTWDFNDFDKDDEISFTFETEVPSAESEVIGGTYTAKFQIGANKGQSFQMDITDMRSQSLEVSGTTAGSKAGGVEGAAYTAVKDVTNGTDAVEAEYALDVSTHDKATAAIEVINNAIESVSAQRSELGAYQNRLEHTINNLATSGENLTAAESRVRDVDMAKEMMSFTKNNILTQAAQTMMAQANQQPQGVLQLLR